MCEERRQRRRSRDWIFPQRREEFLTFSFSALSFSSSRRVEKTIQKEYCQILNLWYFGITSHKRDGRRRASETEEGRPKRRACFFSSSCYAKCEGVRNKKWKLTCNYIVNIWTDKYRIYIYSPYSSCDQVYARSISLSVFLSVSCLCFFLFLFLFPHHLLCLIEECCEN